jgi:hypothetical protein
MVVVRAGWPPSSGALCRLDWLTQPWSILTIFAEQINLSLLAAEPGAQRASAGTGGQFLTNQHRTSLFQSELPIKPPLSGAHFLASQHGNALVAQKAVLSRRWCGFERTTWQRTIPDQRS